MQLHNGDDLVTGTYWAITQGNSFVHYPVFCHIEGQSGPSFEYEQDATLWTTKEECEQIIPEIARKFYFPLRPERFTIKQVNINLEVTIRDN